MSGSKNVSQTPSASRREAWRTEGLWSSDALGVRLERAIRKHGDAPVSFLSTTRPSESTSASLAAEAQALASAWIALGLHPGDRIAVQLPNWRECLVSYLACLSAGFVLVPIVNIYGTQEVRFIVRDSQASLLVIPATYRGKDYCERGRQQLRNGDIDRILVVGGDVNDPAFLHWDHLALLSQAPNPPVVLDPESVAAIIYTSGTTSNPKGVRHTHNSLGTQLDVDPLFTTDQRGGRALTIVPAGHLAGLLDMLRPFFSGEASYILDEWDADLAVDTIVARGVTRSKGTPFHLKAVLDVAARRGADISSLRTWVIGGTSVPSAVIEAALRSGVVACRSYGSSEHPTISRNRPDDPLDKRVFTDGRPQPGVVLRFVDDEGQDVAKGEEGEILSAGPQLFTGYTDATLTEAAFTEDGWFRTGDVGQLDADGYLSITDRKKDIVIRGGENISAKEVEDALASHPSVADVAVVPQIDDVMGERVCAFVILKRDASLSLQDALSHIVSLGMAKQKAPEKLVFVDAFPRTSVGKVRKADLKSALAASTPAP